MEQELLKQAAENGIWVTMFVVLFLYTILDSRRREDKYIEREETYRTIIIENQQMIQELSKQFCIVEDIHKDVTDIKYSLRKGM